LLRGADAQFGKIEAGKRKPGGLPRIRLVSPALNDRGSASAAAIGSLALRSDFVLSC